MVFCNEFHRRHDAAVEPAHTAERIAEEAAQVPTETDLPADVILRHARIPAERVREWQLRLQELVTEFSSQPRQGETTFAFVAGIYPTERKPLAAEQSGATDIGPG